MSQPDPIPPILKHLIFPKTRKRTTYLHFYHYQKMAYFTVLPNNHKQWSARKKRPTTTEHRNRGSTFLFVGKSCWHRGG